MQKSAKTLNFRLLFFVDEANEEERKESDRTFARDFKTRFGQVGLFDQLGENGVELEDDESLHHGVQDVHVGAHEVDHQDVPQRHH